MFRLNQYLRGFRYSAYVRNRNGNPGRYRKPRLWNSSWKSSWKTSSWKSGGNYQRQFFRTRCLNEVLPMPVSTGLEFIHSGYITMPEFGTSSVCRKKQFILHKGVELQGTFRIMSLPVESKEGVSMEIKRVPGPGLDGMVTLFVVLDKRPRGDVLTKFEEIFEGKPGGYRGDATLSNASLDRFSLIMKKHNVFQSKESPRIISFRVPYVPKERIWVKFHDYDEETRGGNFKNIATNGLLYYVVFESHGHCVWSPNVNSCITF